MRILAIDVGTGTQDIMIYDTEKELQALIIKYKDVDIPQLKALPSGNVQV